MNPLFTEEKEKEKELSELEQILSNIKVISDNQDNNWIFTGKPFAKIQNDELVNIKYEIYDVHEFHKIALSSSEKIINQLKENKLSLDHNENFYYEYPFSSIGIVEVIFSDGTKEYGCGSLIMPGVVLTVANFIHSDESKIKIKFNK
jgi:hypothetical protein